MDLNLGEVPLYYEKLQIRGIWGGEVLRHYNMYYNTYYNTYFFYIDQIPDRKLSAIFFQHYFSLRVT